MWNKVFKLPSKQIMKFLHVCHMLTFRLTRCTWLWINTTHELFWGQICKNSEVQTCHQHTWKILISNCKRSYYYFRLVIAESLIWNQCYWFHDIEKLNVFKNCKMEEHPCNIARVVQPCKTWKVETHIGGLPKNGASSPHLWTFICTQQNTQFDVSTKTHLHKNGASGTHRWTFKDNFICHNTLAMWTYTWEHRLCPHGLFSGRTN